MNEQIVAETDDSYHYIADKKKVSFVKGKGVYLYDSQGNAYLDCSAGTFNLSLGYSNDEVIDFAYAQSKKVVHLSSSYQNTMIDQLAEKIVSLAPDNLKCVHFKACGGSQLMRLLLKWP